MQDRHLSFSPSLPVAALTLTVAPTGRIYPSRALCQALGLRGGQRLDVVPPRAKGGGTWYLDLRPHGPTATLTASAARRPEFRTAYELRPAHFQRSAGRGRGRLALPELRLAVEAEEAPGFWRLRWLSPTE